VKGNDVQEEAPTITIYDRTMGLQLMSMIASLLPSLGDAQYVKVGLPRDTSQLTITIKLGKFAGYSAHDAILDWLGLWTPDVTWDEHTSTLDMTEPGSMRRLEEK